MGKPSLECFGLFFIVSSIHFSCCSIASLFFTIAFAFSSLDGPFSIYSLALQSVPHQRLKSNNTSIHLVNSRLLVLFCLFYSLLPQGTTFIENSQEPVVRDVGGSNSRLNLHSPCTQFLDILTRDCGPVFRRSSVDVVHADLFKVILRIAVQPQEKDVACSHN